MLCIIDKYRLCEFHLNALAGQKGEFCDSVNLGHLYMIHHTRREVREPADRRLQTRRMPLWNALDSFIRENLVLPVMYDSVHSVLVK